MTALIARIWERWPFKESALLKLGFDFNIVYGDSVVGTDDIQSVSALIAWDGAPDEPFEVKGISLSAMVDYDHRYSNGDRIYGSLEWRHLSEETSECAVYGTVVLRSRDLETTYPFSGYMVSFPSATPAPPPHILPEPSPPAVPPALTGADAALIHQRPLAEGESFPFLYLSPWPAVTQKRRAAEFFEMPEAFRSKNNTFWNTLVEAKKAGKPDAMQAAAVGLIDADFDGSANPAGLQGGFMAQLEDDIIAGINQVFGGWEQFTAAQTAGEAQLLTIWNTVIALNICLGADHSLLSRLILLLRLLNLLEAARKMTADGSHDEANAESLGSLRAATLVLPEVFPLPPIAPTSGESVQDPSPARIVPYAFGTLETIRYETLAYTAGDIQRIENILVGETRQERRRNLTREEKTDQQIRIEDNFGEKSDRAEAEAFAKELRKALQGRTETTTINNYQSSFGLPSSDEVSISGSWSTAEDPAGGAEERAQDFIRRSASRALRQVNDRVQRRRQTLLLNESETTRVNS
ncbi:hypothetical protein FGG78_26680, partial [Thioclava sp. BHET1]